MDRENYAPAEFIVDASLFIAGDQACRIEIFTGKLFRGQCVEQIIPALRRKAQFITGSDFTRQAALFEGSFSRFIFA
jgi:hypothetical protein